MERIILTIGAYERDNFGDFLFFLVFEYMCAKRNIRLVLGSCIESDMRDYFGKYIFPYHSLLSNHSFDAIWVVGGEIGACTIPMAIEQSIKNVYFDRYRYMEQILRNPLHEYLTGEKSDHLAYLPNMMNYTKNKHTPLIVNSVGGFELLEESRDAFLVQNTMSTLKNAYMVSVRSVQSQKYLLTQGLDTTLVPDSVHALSFFYQPERPIAGEYILFQISKDFFNIHGIEIIAKSLHELVQKYDCPIYFFSAGTANLHDSFEVYEYIKKYIYDTYAEDRIEIIYEKNPLKRVDWIASAKILISSSLHGRIVAISYKVPRISLIIEKLTLYAETWDPLFPYAVALPTLLVECQKALEVDKTYMESIACDLATRARDNIETILNTIYDK